MSVGKKHNNGLRAAGNEIMACTYSTEFDQNAFIKYRSKPQQALFSKKTVNLNYTTGNLSNPNLLITNESAFRSSLRHQDMLQTIETTKMGTDEMSSTRSAMRNSSANFLSSRFNKQGKKYSIDLGQNVSCKCSS